MDEEKLVQKYKEAEKAFYDAVDEVSKYFGKLAKESAERGDMAGVQNIIERCPDNVTRCLIIDATSYGSWVKKEK